MSPTATIDYKLIDMLRGLRSCSESDPVRDLSDAFVSESATRLQQLTAAWSARDPKALRSAAFGFKGMSGSIGAGRLYAISHAIEVAEPGTVDVARIEQLGEEVGRVSAALTAALAA